MRYRLMATYRGLSYEAGVGPTDADVVLFASSAPAAELGFDTASGHWCKRVSRQDIDALWETRPAGRYRNQPCLVLEEIGDRLHITYLGHDAYQAERLGYWQVDRGVYEVVVPHDEVTELTEERVEYPVHRRHGGTAHTAPITTSTATAPAPAPPGEPPAAQPGHQPGEPAAPFAGDARPRRATGPAPAWQDAETSAAGFGTAGWNGAGSRDESPNGTPLAGAPEPPGGGSGRSQPGWDAGPVWDDGLAWDGGAARDAGALGRSPSPNGSGAPGRPAAHDSGHPGQTPGTATTTGTGTGSAGSGIAGSGTAPSGAGAPGQSPAAAVGPAAQSPAHDLPRSRPTVADALSGPAASPAGEPSDSVWADLPETLPPPRPLPKRRRTGARPAQKFAQSPDSAAAPAAPSPGAPPLSASAADPAVTAGTSGATAGHVPREHGSRRRRARVDTRWIFRDLVDMAAIPHTSYAVDEEVDGALCLIKTDDGYEVFSAADGTKHEVRFFDEEEAAYFYLFGVLVAEAIRSGRLAPKPE